MGRMLHDEKFRYVDYKHTDLKRTFARVRQQIRAEKLAQERKEEDAVERLHRLYPKMGLVK
jgi:hypothetical protein